MSGLRKKPWERPTLRSEEVGETLGRPACSFKAPGAGGPPRGGPGPRSQGPAFS